MVYLVSCYTAIENGHQNSQFSHWKWWLSIVILVCQRVSALPVWPLFHVSYYVSPPSSIQATQGIPRQNINGPRSRSSSSLSVKKQKEKRPKLQGIVEWNPNHHIIEETFLEAHGEEERKKQKQIICSLGYHVIRNGHGLFKQTGTLW